MHFVYILKSTTTNKYYIGCTNNLEKRIVQHNNGENKSTANYRPWQIVCYKFFTSQSEAYDNEKLVKSYKGGNGFKKIINRKIQDWIFTPGEVAEWSKAAHC